jgi:hypothetical protein
MPLLMLAQETPLVKYKDFVFEEVSVQRNLLYKNSLTSLISTNPQETLPHSVR